jgi:hypothetical protein
MTRYEDIDYELEKLVFLWNAREGNPGIYELTWELSFHNLTIGDKYKIAHRILMEILVEGLVTLVKYKDFTLTNKIETVTQDKIDRILNSPDSWYPCNEILSIELTEKGVKYLNEQTTIKGDIFNKRLTRKK